MPLAVSVALPVPLRRCFDYVVPAALASPPPLPGERLRVPFGSRERIGIVVGDGSGGTPVTDLKPILARLDPTPLVPPELLALCQWAADYYRHPLGEVLAAALPGVLRRGGLPTRGGVPALRLTEAGRAARPGLPARSTALRALLDSLAEAAGPRAGAGSPAAVKRALASGWIESVTLDAAPPAALMQALPELAEEQAAALIRLREAPAGSGAGTVLLHGITGSGKTELYLRRAADVLATGGQVLVLTPEIGLTPQLAARFTARFGAQVACFHSGLADAARARVWLDARDGRADIVVGTRSAALLPFARLGLIVVDEEHDPSFKQQDGFRYSARDLAVLRGQRLGIPVILGSATPSLETLHNAGTGRYGRTTLTHRIGTATPPRITLLDVRHAPLEQGLSAPLLAAVERHVDAGGQALLFINRRGYAPVLLCRDCRHVMPCPRCDARLVLHRGRNRLICHHCGDVEAVPRQCPACGGRELIALGAGTERIEDALRLRFPDRRVERFDSDRLRAAGSLRRLLDAAASGAIPILVGTQILAKGHDFPRLTLAGLVDVDQALFGADFRALERMGQLVTQVAGRAGRREAPGEVILQTRQPDHPLLRLLVEDGYPAFAEALLAERCSWRLPPYAHLALLRAEAAREDAALGYLRGLRELIGDADGVEILGPAPATMARRAGRWRAQLLLRAETRAPLQRLLDRVIPVIEALPASRRVRWSLDVDPADLF